MKQHRILCFGDSITYGAWDSAGGWVDRMKQHFHSSFTSGSDEKVVVLNLGIGGESSAGLEKRIGSEIEARMSASWVPYVIIATGINDTRAKGSPTAYQSSVEGLIQNLAVTIEETQRFTNKILLVGLTPIVEPGTFKDYYYFNDRIQEFDTAISHLAKAKMLPSVSMFDEMNAMRRTKKFISDDLLHPNDQGHIWMLSKILPEVQKLIH